VLVGHGSYAHCLKCKTREIFGLPPTPEARLLTRSGGSLISQGPGFERVCTFAADMDNFCVAKVNASEAEREDEEDEEENRRRTFIRSKIVLPR
jgi:hypothetical protein